MPLKAINNPDDILKQAEEGPQGLPLVKLPGTDSTRRLLKLKQFGCREVLGYLLAPRIGVPVMPAIPVWCPRAFGEGGQQAGEGRIGLAIKYANPFESITWEKAAAIAPENAAAALFLLCTLGWGEWVQLAVTEYGLVFYDLEELFPCWWPECTNGETWNDVVDRLRDTADSCRGVAPSCLQEVCDEAAKHGLTNTLRGVAANAATISSDELLGVFDLQPHPLAREIGGIAADITVQQFRLAAQYFSH